MMSQAVECDGCGHTVTVTTSMQAGIPQGWVIFVIAAGTLRNPGSSVREEHACCADCARKVFDRCLCNEGDRVTVCVEKVEA